ncbi:MAG: glutathione S-transferase N-terminal domain-containing protein [Zoogloeaceae bacterium]|jgi:glutathione S-transferase|nr:glutathione S-transferase N-terminal domain-containing protein [Zoogloeaceae bacterium]
MKLIGSLSNPYVRKTRIVLAEKKIEYHLELPPSGNDSAASPDCNPLGWLPVLVLDDGTPIFDARVIVEYIDNISPNNNLFPSANRERTEVKRWEAVADGLLDAVALAHQESARPTGERRAAFIRQQQEKISRCLAFMEQNLGNQPFCTGKSMTLADLAVGTALSYLFFRFPNPGWNKTHPFLAQLYDKLEQRPSFQETMFQEA